MVAKSRMYESSAKGRSRSAPTASGRATKSKAPSGGGARKGIANALNAVGRNARASTQARESLGKNLSKVKAPGVKSPIDWGTPMHRQAPNITIGPRKKRP